MATKGKTGYSASTNAMDRISEENILASLDKSKSDLLHFSNVSGFVDSLRNAEVLNAGEYEETCAQETDEEKVQRMLRIVTGKKTPLILKFLDVLAAETNSQATVSKIKRRACLYEVQPNIFGLRSDIRGRVIEGFTNRVPKRHKDLLLAKGSHEDKLQLMLDEIIPDSRRQFMTFLDVLLDQGQDDLEKNLSKRCDLDEFDTVPNSGRPNTSAAPTVTSMVKDKSTHQFYVEKATDLSDMSNEQYTEVYNQLLLTLQKLADWSHNYIVRILKQKPKKLTIYSEFYDLKSISDWLKMAKTPFDEASTIRCIYLTAIALIDLKRVKGFHGNLKPSNVFFTKDSAILVDVGLREIMLHSEYRFMVDDSRYTAPEVVQGKQLTSASDVWSLGAIAFELLTRSNPKRAKEREALACSKPLKALLLKMLEDLPTNRPGIEDVLKSIAPLNSEGTHSNRTS